MEAIRHSTSRPDADEPIATMVTRTLLTITFLLGFTAPTLAAGRTIPRPPQVAAVATAIDHYNAGTALHTQGKTTAAVEAYRQALRLDPRHYDSYFNLGAALWDLDRNDEAIAALLEAHRIAPQRPEAVKALITMYQWLKRPADVQRFETVLVGIHKASQQASAAARQANADRLIRQGLRLAGAMTPTKLQEAAKVLDKALAQEPRYAAALAAKSLVFGWLSAQAKRRGKPTAPLTDQARHWANKAFASHAQASLAHVAMAYSHYLQGQPKWRVYAQSARHQDPRNAFAHWIDGLRLEHEHQPQQALTAYREAIRLDGTQALFQIALAGALDDAERYADAERAWQAAIRLSPGYEEAHSGLGYTYLHQGHWKPAIAAFQKAITADPAQSLNHSALAMACLADDQSSEAVAHCQKAISLDPKQAENHYRYARILHDLGGNQTADAEFRLAISLDPGSKLYREAYERFRKSLKP